MNHRKFWAKQHIKNGKEKRAWIRQTILIKSIRIEFMHFHVENCAHSWWFFLFSTSFVSIANVSIETHCFLSSDNFLNSSKIHTNEALTTLAHAVKINNVLKKIHRFDWKMWINHQTTESFIRLKEMDDWLNEWKDKWKILYVYFCNLYSIYITKTAIDGRANRVQTSICFLSTIYDCRIEKY